MAFIALKPGASAAGPAELDAHCRGHLAPHKRPRAFRFLAELPKSHYGKVLKGELAKLGTEGRA
jgi:acyl-coenzyme A synthetase/AMP-(fatty) acid ligase